MRSWLTAVRIARREAGRAKGRSLLVLALIAIPVMLLTFAAASIDMADLTKAEELDRKLGQADAEVSWVADLPIEQDAEGIAYRTRAEAEGKATVGEDLHEHTTAAELLSVLPSGSRVAMKHEFSIRLKTPDGIGVAQAYMVPVGEPMLDGYLSVLEGRAPQADNEIALNAEAAQWLGVGVGGEVSSNRPERVYKVVALVEMPARLSSLVVFRPGAVPGVETDASTSWLVDTPSAVDWAGVKALNAKGIKVVSREVVLNPPAEALNFWDNEVGSGVPARELGLGAIVAGLALLEIVLLAGPAFAVGARRRARDLALVAAAGGSPKQLRRIVLADGLVLGVVAAVVGLLGGLVMAVVGRPLIEEHISHARAGGWRFYPAALAVIAVLAVVTGLLAAMVPAFTAARQDVVVALAGRRGATRSRKRWIAVGLLLLFSGIPIAWYGASRVDSNLILLGVIIGELGLVLLTPGLVGLISRVGRWLPLTFRIALRDTSRNRASAAPAISAVMAAVAGAVAIGVYIGSQEQQRIEAYQPRLPTGNMSVVHYQRTRDDVEPDWAAVAQVVKQVMPDATPAVYGRPGCAPDEMCYLEAQLPVALQCPDGLSPEQVDTDPRCQGYGASLEWLLVGEDSLLPALVELSPERLGQAREVLRSGGALVSDARLLVNGKVTLAIYQGKADDKQSLGSKPPPTIDVPGMALPEMANVRTMVSPVLLSRVGLKYEPAALVVDTVSAPGQPELEKLRQRFDELGASVEVNVESGPGGRSTTPTLVLALAAALIALGASGVATGLSAADGRADLGTLAAVGAGPGLRRRLSLSHAGVISGVGTLLGSLAGMGAATAIIQALNLQAKADPGYVQMKLFLPTQSLLIMLAVPLLAMLGAGLLTRSRLPIEQRM